MAIVRAYIVHLISHGSLLDVIRQEDEVLFCCFSIFYTKAMEAGPRIRPRTSRPSEFEIGQEFRSCLGRLFGIISSSEKRV